MRLDTYLVEKGYFISRSSAKNAIKSGYIRINEKIITKPSKDIDDSSIIEITEKANMPKGYFKLKLIQEKTSILNKNDNVLDLGSSAGGFLLYACEIVKHIQGIEFSLDFKKKLETISSQHENVDIIFADVFTLNLKQIMNTKVDVILSDMTIEPVISILALKKVLPILKERGKILQVLKIQNQAVDPLISEIETFGITVTHIIEPQTKEIYIVGIKEENCV